MHEVRGEPLDQIPLKTTSQASFFHRSYKTRHGLFSGEHGLRWLRLRTSVGVVSEE